MKTYKTIALAVLLLTLLLSLCLLGACSREENLKGKVIVTFEFNGGILDNSSTNVEGHISHAYEPNSYVLDISGYQNYKFTRKNFVFEGWYKDEDCLEAWDFSKDRVKEDMTLYAKWVPDIVYTYGVYMSVSGQEPVLLGRYTVSAGDKFEDRSSYCNKVRDHNRTFLGNYYSDAALTTKWDKDFVHPGGNESKEIPVYVDSMEGRWRFVTNYDELIAAFRSSDGVMLNNDIDCEGKDLYVATFNATLQGNGFTISNFNVPAQSRTVVRKYSLFGTLTAKAQILNVKFSNALYVLTESVDTYRMEVAAFAQTITAGARIEGVTFEGAYESQLEHVFNENGTNVHSIDDVTALMNKWAFESIPEGTISDDCVLNVTLKQN